MSTALSIPDYFVIVNSFSDTVNNLGATLDSTNVLNLVRTAKFERRGISSIGNLLATKSTATLVSAFIISNRRLTQLSLF